MGAIELEQYLHDASRPYHVCLEACVECLVASEMCSDGCLAEEHVHEMTARRRCERECRRIAGS